MVAKEKLASHQENASKRRNKKELSENKQDIKNQENADDVSADRVLKHAANAATADSSCETRKEKQTENGYLEKDVAKKTDKVSKWTNQLSFDSKPPAVTIQVDIAAVLIFVASVITRMWRLDQPRGIVFDELHYGKFTSLYMKQIFFFDTHPPLGKQLVALVGYLTNYDGNMQFDRIGGEYPAQVPLYALRSVPAFFGSCLAPTMYYLIVELGLTHKTAALAGLLIVFENAFLTQSRFILMEGILLWFSVFGILALLKFRKEYERPYGLKWWFWLLTCSASLSCAVCVKYVGIFSFYLAILVIIWDYWKMIAYSFLTTHQLLIHLLARVMAVSVLPTCIYLTVFYIHLNILTKAGPHDNIMTSAFQASLEGGLASITKGQPLEVAHGSQVTLRHSHGRACWLHSHPPVYPVRYPDKRGSSHQQQVTCYTFKDVNNWWIVKRPETNDLVVSEPLDKIKHGDVVQLIHGMTSRPLNSHDVAAAMSPQHQEVSCYIDYNISFPAQDLWQVDITNRDTEGSTWHTIHSHVRLIHKSSGQALKFSGKHLPEWGFHQHEVVTDRVVKQDDTIWNVEEHRYTKNADQKERERDMGMAEFVPLQPTQLTFFEKLWELQYKMLFSNNQNVQDHMYSSEVLDFPFLTRGIAYWVSPNSNAQIHLLGNIMIWYAATASVLVYLAFLAFYLLRRRRGCFDIPEDIWLRFCTAGEIGLGGYLLHFIPYFLADRTLFLHHYLPAYIFNVMLLVAVIEHVELIIRYLNKPLLIRIFYMMLILWMAVAIYSYVKISVFSYGTTHLAPEDIIKLRWKDTWDFIVHKS